MLNVQNILKDHLLVIEILNVFKQLEGQNGALGLRQKTVIPMKHHIQNADEQHIIFFD